MIPNPDAFSDVDARIEAANKDLLDESGQKIKRFPNVSDLASANDPAIYQIYVGYYQHSSKFEHSDPSTLEVYREKISENEYRITTSKTDTGLIEHLLEWAPKFFIRTMTVVQQFAKSRDQAPWDSTELFAIYAFMIDKNLVYKD